MPSAQAWATVRALERQRNARRRWVEQDEHPNLRPDGGTGDPSVAFIAVRNARMALTTLPTEQRAAIDCAVDHGDGFERRCCWLERNEQTPRRRTGTNAGQVGRR